MKSSPCCSLHDVTVCQVVPSKGYTLPNSSTHWWAEWPWSFVHELLTDLQGGFIAERFEGILGELLDALLSMHFRSRFGVHGLEKLTLVDTKKASVVAPGSVNPGTDSSLNHPPCRFNPFFWPLPILPSGTIIPPWQNSMPVLWRMKPGMHNHDVFVVF